MKRTLRVYLEDIVESIEAIGEYTADLSAATFLQSRLIQDAVARRLHIIGEAAKSVPDEVRKRYSSVPWADVAGMRDRLARAYFGVNMKLVWHVVERDLAPLRQTAERMAQKPGGPLAVVGAERLRHPGTSRRRSVHVVRLE